MPVPITEDEKSNLLLKISGLFIQYGFDNISMDEVSRRIKLSKATLYKYFISKEDIVREMVKQLILHLKGVQLTTDQGIEGVLQGLSAVYFKAAVASAFASSRFLDDLESKFPAMYTAYNKAWQDVWDRFIFFYENARKEGYCRDISISLVAQQLQRTLPAVMNTGYIIDNQTTLPIVVKDYYQLLLCQVIHPDYMAVIEQGETYDFLDQLLKVLKNSFLAQ